MMLPVRREQTNAVWDPFREFHDLYERMANCGSRPSREAAV